MLYLLLHVKVPTKLTRELISRQSCTACMYAPVVHQHSRTFLIMPIGLRSHIVSSILAGEAKIAL